MIKPRPTKKRAGDWRPGKLPRKFGNANLKKKEVLVDRSIFGVLSGVTHLAQTTLSFCPKVKVATLHALSWCHNFFWAQDMRLQITQLANASLSKWTVMPLLFLILQAMVFSQSNAGVALPVPMKPSWHRRGKNSAVPQQLVVSSFSTTGASWQVMTAMQPCKSAQSGIFVPSLVVNNLLVS